MKQWHARHRHPGEVIREEYMEPFGVTIEALARDLHFGPKDMENVLEGRMKISDALAQRLAKRFGTLPHFWLHLQENYDRDARVRLPRFGL